jgi:hypothetical protein
MPAVTASSSPFTAAQVFAPHFWKNGIGSTWPNGARKLASMSAMYCLWCTATQVRSSVTLGSDSSRTV